MSKRSSTAVATLLTFCPPGPVARTKRSTISCSGMVIGGWVMASSAGIVGRRCERLVHSPNAMVGAAHGRETSADRTSSRPWAARSEEHTSELQSLMRISYAVFCLKKKKKNNTTRNDHNTHDSEIAKNK